MAKILKIITLPDNNLRDRSIPLAANELRTKGLSELCDNMAETMLKSDGVGLAAPQIGRKIRLVVINSKDGILAMANPVIKKKSWRKEWGEEGCLSVPKTFGLVKRHLKITCVFLDPTGKEKKIEAAGLFARVIQHEIDHLDGVLFIDKAKKVKREGL